MRRKRTITAILLILSTTSFILFGLPPNVNCTTESLLVQANGSISQYLSMENGEYATGSFSVSGAKNKAHNKIVFKVNNPEGTEIYEYRIEGATYDGVSSAEFTIIASNTGVYELIFDNTRLRFSEELVVKIDYSVKKLTHGLTQETLFLIVTTIVVATVVVAVTLVLFIKRRRLKFNPKPKVKI